MKRELLPEDILRFLKLAYLGKSENSIELAGKRAYRDFCRTIRNFKSNDFEERKKVRDSVISLIADEVKICPLFKNQSEYDKWHTTLCEKIINNFSSQATLFYGQAQKWLNMTIKYSVVLAVPQITQFIPFLHAPVDNKVLEMANNNLKVHAQDFPWSKWSKEIYIDYQNKLRIAVPDNTTPFVWEFINWEPFSIEDE